MDLTEQATAIANSFTTPPESKAPAYKRLTRAQEALIVKLCEQGQTQTQIAQVIGCSQPTVHRVLNEFGDTRTLAKQIAHNGAARLMERVVDKANVAEAVDVLERIEVLAPKKSDSGARGGVQIIIGMPNQPAALPPAIDLSPVPARELGQ